MSLQNAALDVGRFLLENADVVRDVAEAIAAGTPKEAIQAAVRGAMVKVSDAAIAEELAAAESRR